MADNKQPQQPRTIFEAINQNVVDLSQDVVQLYNVVEQTRAMVNEIHAALYPPMQPIAEPDVPGAETEE
ncbi:MAG: hypothetical protein K2K82_00985 [Muribaculaceae bacterium]|nr:hypothetical protein [Muribaculaceae bacterium]